MPPRRVVLVSTLVLLIPAAGVRADTTPQTVPYAQDWTDTTLVSVDDDWSAAPGVTGYRGDGLTSAVDADPQGVTAASAVVDVAANQTSPSATFGGVAEFELADPVVALQPSGTADVPSVVFSLDTRGLAHVEISYLLRDLDASADDAVQQVALQYRVGADGPFVNIPAGYVPDATSGTSSATLETPVRAVLPEDAEQRSLVEVRVLTSNASGSDEWVGIDDVEVTATPGATCSADGSTLQLQLPSGGGATVRRAGTAIEVIAPGIADQTCGLSPGEVVARVVASGTGGAESLTIDLGGGSFGDIAWDLELGAGADALVVLGSAADDRMRFGRTGANLDGDADAEVDLDGVDRVELHGRGGDDGILGNSAFGADRGGSTRPLVIHGDEGADKISGGRGNDVLDGGPGDDTLNQLAVLDGADVITGGPGFDTLRYGMRPVGHGLQVLLDGLPNDGESGGAEGDDVAVDVERVIGGRGDDVIRAFADETQNQFFGGDGDDFLAGGGGGDWLSGQAGADVLQGEAGDDRLRAGDGIGGNDSAVGGEGRDRCTVDPGDHTDGCEL